MILEQQDIPLLIKELFQMFMDLHAIPNRMTINQLFEVIGKACCIKDNYGFNTCLNNNINGILMIFRILVFKNMVMK